MTDRRLNRLDRAAPQARPDGWGRALAIASILILAPLAACERQAYDAPTSTVAPPPPPPPALAGAPTAPVEPDAGPPPMEAPSAAPNPYAQPGAPPPYATSGAPAGIVAMEPIPNPPEASTPVRRLRRERGSLRFVTRSAHDVAPRRRETRASFKPPAHRTHVVRPPVAPAVASPTRSQTETDGRSKATVATADHSRNVADLQGVLADAVQKSAILRPATQDASTTPGEVTLTLPADFADTVRTESGRRGLSEAAASVNILARLSDGDAQVTPDEAQIQPLLSGQPTRFRWTVANPGAAKGAMRAALKAQLLGGGGDTLDLGSVTGSQPAISAWKIVGVVLLAIVGLTLVAALGRRRARERSATVAGRPLPFDMNRTG